jgi:ribosome biogenesis SPOUT family RNA methylase Rps3
MERAKQPPLIADCIVKEFDNIVFGSFVGDHKRMGRGDEERRGAMTELAAYDLNMRVDLLLAEESHDVVFDGIERRNVGVRVV